MDKFFHIKERNSTVRTEIVGGIVTFFAMAYIIFVNPSYLSQTGMNYHAVLPVSYTHLCRQKRRRRTGRSASRRKRTARLRTVFRRLTIRRTAARIIPGLVPAGTTLRTKGTHPLRVRT